MADDIAQPGKGQLSFNTKPLLRLLTKRFLKLRVIFIKHGSFFRSVDVIWEQESVFFELFYLIVGQGLRHDAFSKLALLV